MIKSALLAIPRGLTATLWLTASLWLTGCTTVANNPPSAKAKLNQISDFSSLTIYPINQAIEQLVAARAIDHLLANMQYDPQHRVLADNDHLDFTLKHRTQLSEPRYQTAHQALIKQVQRNYLTLLVGMGDTLTYHDSEEDPSNPCCWLSHYTAVTRHNDIVGFNLVIDKQRHKIVDIQPSTYRYSLNQQLSLLIDHLIDIDLAPDSQEKILVQAFDTHLLAYLNGKGHFTNVIKHFMPLPEATKKQQWLLELLYYNTALMEHPVGQVLLADYLSQTNPKLPILVSYYISLKKYQQAELIIQENPDYGSQSIANRLGEVIVYSSLNKHDKALELATALYQQAPDNISVVLALLAVALKSGDVELTNAILAVLRTRFNETVSQATLNSLAE